MAERYFVDGGVLTDVDVFRAAYFFQEDAPIARWRAGFMAMLYPGLSGATTLSVPAMSGLKLLHSEDGDCGDVAKSDSACDPVTSLVETIAGGGGSVRSVSFAYSVLMADHLRRYRQEVGLEPEEIVRLLAASSNVHEYVDRDTILNLLGMEHLARSKLLVFILRDLLFRRYRSPDDELDRRAAFMEMFTIGGHSEIVPFLDELAAWSRVTATHVARLCTRTFLERLYLLVSSVQEVVVTRIAVCEWMIANGSRDQETIREERDALERELANLDARSDLDSTRVHVDEDSLREWYDETQRALDSRYRQTVITEGSQVAHGTFLDVYNKSRERPKTSAEGEDLLSDTQIGSEFTLLTIFENTLRAFVSDKTFGLDSYLSRRIRHGTLRGFLTTPLARVRRKLAEEIEGEERQVERAELEGVAERMDGWLSILTERLDHLRREVIQIRSDRHPDGLIEATWRTPTNVRHLDAMMARTRLRVLENRSDYDVFNDLYLLCWDFLERDLAHLRVHLNRDFWREMSGHLASLFAELTPEQKAPGSRYWHELHTVLNGRIQEVCGWFIRPVFRRNAYDLRTLAESTISIVRELDDTYVFADCVDIEGVSINRGSFDVLGDILFVLIGNAAKHGKLGGLVKVNAEVADGDEPLIRLCVTSQVQDAEAFALSETRMTRAADPRDLASIHSAGVIEGFSGIRKIIGLLGRIRAAEDLSLHFDAETLTVSCRVVVPATISFARERT